jgi:hypothetical protein
VYFPFWWLFARYLRAEEAGRTREKWLYLALALAVSIAAFGVNYWLVQGPETALMRGR